MCEYAKFLTERQAGMYSVGQYVVCGNKGVCTIEDITTLDISGVDKAKLYYILKPRYITASTDRSACKPDGRRRRWTDGISSRRRTAFTVSLLLRLVWSAARFARISPINCGVRPPFEKPETGKNPSDRNVAAGGSFLMDIFQKK